MLNFKDAIEKIETLEKIMLGCSFLLVIIKLFSQAQNEKKT